MGEEVGEEVGRKWGTRRSGEDVDVRWPVIEE